MVDHSDDAVFAQIMVAFEADVEGFVWGTTVLAALGACSVVLDGASRVVAARRLVMHRRGRLVSAIAGMADARNLICTAHVRAPDLGR